MNSKPKTIEIDDSGTGDLVGDAFIGFHVIETGQLLFKEIPVNLYNDKNLSKGAPKKRILQVVKNGLEELGYNKDIDKIRLCRGDCFDMVRIYFEKNAIYYEPSVIDGILQTAVEAKFVTHLRNLGVRSKNLTIESGARRYFILFNWVYRDFPKREKYVKSGFKKWKSVWRERAIENYKKHKNSTYKKKRE
ncbi:MAG: hypothetical protein JXA99_08595 [Candidatus Lokiarchaeota archaeon]|nr:hypothetical protein [Candidatus Lokiarchaeota archaeon]